jgi:hypothetical protein
MALVNRFYTRQSFKRHAKDVRPLIHPHTHLPNAPTPRDSSSGTRAQLVAGACFYLACKLEESAVDVRHVTNYLHRALTPRGAPAPTEDEWNEREAAILQKEKVRC